MKRDAEEAIINLLETLVSLEEIDEAKPLNSTEAAKYLSIAQSTLYRLTSAKKIPFHKPNGKYLYFFREELDDWIAGPDTTEVVGFN